MTFYAQMWNTLSLMTLFPIKEPNGFLKVLSSVSVFFNFESCIDMATMKSMLKAF